VKGSRSRGADWWAGKVLLRVDRINDHVNLPCGLHGAMMMTRGR
jgi:hypothetical protein